ncbi:MAG: hypothetical protein PHT84_01500 [Candidatus Pacebacteria bacterium]|nr:hypothetical protein [Candidatus Paceibacterota bacterium]
MKKKAKKITSSEVVCTGNRCCSICGGIFDTDDVCNIGKHIKGVKYPKQ